MLTPATRRRAFDADADVQSHHRLGVLDIAQRHGSLSIERIQFTVSPSAMADLITTAATFNGVLCWNFVYNAPRIGAARVAALADAAVELLEAALRSK